MRVPSFELTGVGAARPVSFGAVACAVLVAGVGVAATSVL